MKESRILPEAFCAVLCLMTATISVPALTLTGNVENDFVGTETVIVADGTASDVGLPPSWPYPLSGWDIKDVRFFYDRANDVLYVGINFFVIGGDADGDGDPSTSSPALTSRGGADLASLGSSEAIQIEFDWNEDGVFDTIAGVPNDANATAFSIAPDLLPTQNLPAASARFGSPIAGVVPFVGAASASAPDFEFKIPNVSALPGFSATTNGFSFRAFAGSFQDDGIGEDFVGNSGAVHVDLPAPAPEPPAAPGVTLTELIVSRSYFNFWGTATGESLTAVEYKIDKKQWSRFERAKGTTSWRFGIRRDGFQSLRVVIRAVNSQGTTSPEMVVEIQP